MTLPFFRFAPKRSTRKDGLRGLVIIALAATMMVLAVPAAPAATEQELARARAERAAVQKELDRAVAAYDAAQAKLAQTEASMEAGHRALEQAEARERAAQSRLSQRADILYRRGPVTIFHFLMGSENLSDFGRRLNIIEEASRQDAVVINEAARTRNEITALQQQLEAENRQQQTLISSMSSETQSLNESFSKAQGLESTLASDRAAARQAEQNQAARIAAEARAASEARERQEEEARNQAEARAEAEAEAARQRETNRAAASPSPSPTPTATSAPPAAPAPTGSMACPVDGPHSFTDTFGAPRSGGRSHQGVDIFAPMRSPAAAIVDGVILRRNSSPLGGLALYLKGDNGHEYFYAHLAGYNDVGVGQRVKAGDHIAYVGDTGNARGGPPHIHFEIKTSSGIINPTPTVRRACG